MIYAPRKRKTPLLVETHGTARVDFDKPRNVSGLRKPKKPSGKVRTVNVKRPPVSGFARHLVDVVAIDSAKLEPAWVSGEGGEIWCAGFQKDPGLIDSDAGDWYPDLVVWEKARSYPGDPRPQDIIDESCGGALLAGSFRARKLQAIFPDEWGGQRKKAARAFRIWGTLTGRERAVIAKAGGMKLSAVARYIDKACAGGPYSHKIHNLIDAAGIYLFAVGRIGRGAKRV